MADCICEMELRSFIDNLDYNAQRELFRICFPETDGAASQSAEHYRWKFRSFPAAPPAYEYVANEDGQLVGYYAAIPYQYWIKDRLHTVAMICDVMTHPQMRGRGVFKKLGAHATSELQKEGLSFATGYPVRPEVIPGHLSVGWRIMFELPVYVVPLRLDAVLKERNLGILSPLARGACVVWRRISSLINMIFGGREKLQQCEVRSVIFSQGSFTKEYEDFLSEWRRGVGVTLNKNCQFLDWRLQAPDTEYHISSLRSNGKIVGLAISRRTSLQGIPSLAVLDMMIHPSFESYVSLLHNELYALAVQQEVELIAIMCSRTSARRLKLLRNSFIKTPLEFKFILKELSPELDSSFLGEEQNWSLMWLDSDDL